MDVEAYLESFENAVMSALEKRQMAKDGHVRVNIRWDA